MYLLVAVFVVVIALFQFLPHSKQPEYDFISAMKVAHDMGQNTTNKLPVTPSSSAITNYEFGADCNDNPMAVNINYYDYGLAAGSNKKVCVK